MKRQDLSKFKIPDTPGVYRFKRGKEILYIGRATSLKDRVRSYFSEDLISSRGMLLVDMVTQADRVEWQETGSVLEAMIVEALLIKQHQPLYNTKEKDNKSFNHIVVTDEMFPRVLVVRGKEIEDHTFSEAPIKESFGPFPQGGELKKALQIIRKIFPFRDTCEPRQGKPCFNRQIGLCPGVCTGEISSSAYQKHIGRLSLFLQGKQKVLLQTLKKEMKSAARKKEFEYAGELKRTLFSLQHIQDVSLIGKEKSFQSGGSTPRIEGYDVAHTAGTHTVGVMVAMIGGIMDRKAYRTFNIQTVTNDDIGALRELLTRRLAHEEWGLPDIIVLDGGSVHQQTGERMVREMLDLSIPVVSVSKDSAHRAQKIHGNPRLIKKNEDAFLLVNHEAHRFALRAHRNRQQRHLQKKRVL